MVPETDRPSRSLLCAVRASAASTCCAFVVSGCAALNVQAYSGATRPADQVAKLRALEAQILTVDDTSIKEQCGGRLMKDCYVFLLPGPHSMRVQPMSLNGGGGPGYIAPTAATSGMYAASSAYYLPVGDPVTVKYVVLAGHDYSLMTNRNCVAHPATTPHDEWSRSTDKGLCLVDMPTGEVIHAE